MVDRSSFLTVSNSGKVEKIAGAYLKPSNRALVVEGGVESSGIIQAAGLAIPSIAADVPKLLYIDPQGVLTSRSPENTVMVTSIFYYTKYIYNINYLFNISA